jgi:hypothetical protein
MKTNFLNKLKQGLFLLIAVLGTFITYAQTTPTIGGSKTPSTGGLLNIGGKLVPPVTLFANSSVTAHLVTKVFEIGGTGGQERRKLAIGINQVPPRRFCELCVGLTSEIGGHGTTRTYTEIGGNQAPPPRRVSKLYVTKEIGGKGTSTDTGQIKSSNGVATLDTVKVSIGGKSTSGGLGKNSSTVGFKNSIDHNFTLAIGGIGGRGTDSGTGQKSAGIAAVTFSNSKTDIGGRSTGGDYTISGIGGQGSVPPRRVFEVTPIIIPIGGNSVPRA